MFTESCGLVQHIRAKGRSLWNPASYGRRPTLFSGCVTQYRGPVTMLYRVNACFQADLAAHPLPLKCLDFRRNLESFQRDGSAAEIHRGLPLRDREAGPVAWINLAVFRFCRLAIKFHRSRLPHIFPRRAQPDPGPLASPAGRFRTT